MTNTQTLLEEILAACARHEMAPTTFGLRAVNNSHLVRRLQDNQSVTLRTADRVREFIASLPGEPINGGE